MIFKCQPLSVRGSVLLVLIKWFRTLLQEVKGLLLTPVRAGEIMKSCIGNIGDIKRLEFI